MEDKISDRVIKAIDDIILDIEKTNKSLTAEPEIKVEAAPEPKAEIKEPPKEEVKKSEDANEGTFDEIGHGKGEGEGDVSLTANGGHDVIKNKEKKLETLKKPKDDEDEDEEDEDGKKVSKKKMKKSEENKIEISQEDFDLLQKAKADKATEAALKDFETSPINKSFSKLTELVSTLSKKVEDLSKTPARKPKALNGYQPIHKSGAEEKTNRNFTKGQVLNVMSDLVKAKRISDTAVCEYESWQTFSDPRVKEIVNSELNKR